jgi:hypothetical protein
MPAPPQTSLATPVPTLKDLLSLDPAEFVEQYTDVAAINAPRAFREPKT